MILRVVLSLNRRSFKSFERIVDDSGIPVGSTIFAWKDFFSLHHNKILYSFIVFRIRNEQLLNIDLASCPNGFHNSASRQDRLDSILQRRQRIISSSEEFPEDHRISPSMGACNFRNRNIFRASMTKTYEADCLFHTDRRVMNVS